MSVDISGYVLFDKQVIPFIEHHANKNTGKEIYGWLLGYERWHLDATSKDRKTQHILAAYACHNYRIQTLINAEPDPNELSALDSMLSQGIANIGMYHSHPKGVFHSHTDDKTLLEMGKIYPDIISIVTNGEETHCFKIIDSEVKEIPIVTKTFQPEFIITKISSMIKLDKQKQYFNVASKFENDLQIQLEENWESRDEKSNIINLELDEFNYGSDFTLPLTIRSSIFGDLKNTPQKHIIEAIKKTGYELITSANQKYDLLQNGIINYFNIPMKIYPKSFARKSAKNRSKLIEKFSPEVAKYWKRIQN